MAEDVKKNLRTIYKQTYPTQNTLKSRKRMEVSISHVTTANARIKILGTLKDTVPDYFCKKVKGRHLKSGDYT